MNSPIRIINCVTTDLVTDQRVHKISTSLTNAGYAVHLVGRRKKDSKDMPARAYKTQRFNLWFEKGPLFYANYNIRLFFFLLGKKADIFIANDLDTLLAVYLASKLKRVKMTYDNHEYFCGMPELKKRPLVLAVWRSIERFIFPKLTYIYTDNDSKKMLLERDYGREVKVVKNVPVLELKTESNTKVDLPVDRFILIYQGAGINIERGTEELTQAMQYLDERFLLLFVGSGDVIDILKTMVVQLKLENKVKFVDKVPLEILQSYTRAAHLGLTLDKPVSDNYIYSLPNKLFDYVHAGIPVLASRLVEIEKMINTYKIGSFVENYEPRHIAQRIQEIYDNKEEYTYWKSNLSFAAQSVNWQNEEKVLLSIYEQLRNELN